MAQIVFYLKSEKLDKQGKISLLTQITSDYKVYRMKLGKVRLRYWNKETVKNASTQQGKQSSWN